MNKKKLQMIRERHYPKNARPVITELRKVSSFAPAQWDGVTLTGEVVYIRYRTNNFQIWIGAKPLDLEDPKLRVELQHDGEQLSRMKTEEMVQVAKPFVTFQCNR